MAELYADENFSHRVVEVLRALGHDVLTARDAGQANRGVDDEQVLHFATTRSRAVLTLNRVHFIRLHAISSAHTGIIVCTYDEDAAALAVRIHAAIRGHASLAGQLIRVNRPG